MADLTHRERIETVLAGQKPDRIPIALWRHFPVDDQDPDSLAAAAARFQHLYDFDLVKITPTSSFCLKDWGSQDQWNGVTEGTRDYTKFPITHMEDWAALKTLNPSMGYLGAHLHCVRQLVKEFAPHTPVLQTIFSPLAQAKNLAGKDHLLVHLRQFPDAVHAGLETITQTTIRFIEEAVKAGIDGVFYAVQHAQYGLLSKTEFETFGKAYDLRVLEACQSLWANMVHLHGENVMFDQVAGYPVQIINWHDRHTPPTLSKALKCFNGVVCGGLRRQETMVLGDPSSVRQEAIDAIRSTDGLRLILGTGCVLPVTAPHANIQAAVESVSNKSWS